MSPEVWETHRAKKVTLRKVIYGPFNRVKGNCSGNTQRLNILNLVLDLLILNLLILVQNSLTLVWETQTAPPLLKRKNPEEWQYGLFNTLEGSELQVF